MSDSEKESSQLKVRISITQKIGIFFLIPVFIVGAGFIIYDRQLADPSVIAVTGAITFIIFLATAYLFIRKLVKKQYEAYLRLQLMIITDELTINCTIMYTNLLVKPFTYMPLKTLPFVSLQKVIAMYGGWGWIRTNIGGVADRYINILPPSRRYQCMALLLYFNAISINVWF